MEFTETKKGMSKEMPSRVVIYGEPKIGKSRLAAEWPDVFALDVESGLEYTGKEVRSNKEPISSYDDLIAWLRHIYDSETFTAGTIVIDTADWVEELAQNRLAKLHNAKSITDPTVKEFAFFKGVMQAADDAIIILKWLDAIWKKKNIRAVLVAHSHIKNIDMPNQDNYARHEMKLSKYFGSKVLEWADLVLFAGKSYHISKKGEMTEPKPVLYAGGNLAFVGGGRMKLSKELPMNYQSLEKEITQ